MQPLAPADNFKESIGHWEYEAAEFSPSIQDKYFVAAGHFTGRLWTKTGAAMVFVVAFFYFSYTVRKHFWLTIERVIRFRRLSPAILRIPRQCFET